VTYGELFVSFGAEVDGVVRFAGLRELVEHLYQRPPPRPIEIRLGDIILSEREVELFFESAAEAIARALREKS
jgi:hypothetical protein